MHIEFTAPVYPVDDCSERAFLEILNLILLSKHIVELNRQLIHRNTAPRYRQLSGYFRWSFAGNSFTLWQRTAFGSEECFRPEILSLHFGALLCRDRTPPQGITV